MHGRTKRSLAVLGIIAVVAAGANAMQAAAAPATASIAGTALVGGTGAPVGGLTVELYHFEKRVLYPPFGNGRPFYAPSYIESVQTAGDGTYAFTALPASDSRGYLVCFDPVFTFSYQPACYLNQVGYDPFPNPLGLVQVPPGTTPIHVAAGHRADGIDANMVDLAVLNEQTAGTVAGKVTQTLFGIPLRGVKVHAMTPSGQIAGEGLTDGAGNYTVGFLPAGSGYTICFDGSSATGGVSLGAYKSACLPGKVTVTAGATTQNVNESLAATL